MSAAVGTIAVVADGTPASRAALDFAVAMARDKSFRLKGVFVLDTGWADFIGHDWQSSRNTRQGFLDYVRRDQERHAELAGTQFKTATCGFPSAQFVLLVGDPTQALIELMSRGQADTLVLAKDAFKECGRPSTKGLARTLARKVRQPVVVV